MSSARASAEATLSVLCAIITVLVVIEFALAGYGAFGASFAPHETLGWGIGLMSLLILIVALVARPSRRAILLATLVFVLAGPVQPLLANLGWDSAVLGALHAFVGTAIFGMTGTLRMYIEQRRVGADVPSELSKEQR